VPLDTLSPGLIPPPQKKLMSSTPEQASPNGALTRGLLFLLAATAGLSVANIYFNQPLLDEFRRSFPDEANWVGAVPTATQLGYAAGMFFLAPLGDRFERRTLILFQIVGLCIMLVAAALAPNLITLVAASLFIGILATIAQQVVPFAAELAAPEERGAAVGFVMSGLLLGILLARTVSGELAGHFGWRVVFGAAVGSMVVLGAIIALRLPRRKPGSQLPYGLLLMSIWHLVREEPLLRNASITGAALFASFSAFWSVLALLLSGAPFHLGAEAAGLFGIVGAAGALVAPLAGRSADTRGPNAVIKLAIWLTALSFVIFAGSSRSLIGLVIGVLVLDIGIQAAQISNQSRIYSIRPEARSRMNTVYMVSYFIGGAFGSAAGAFAWRHAGWLGVSGVGLLCAVVAGLNHRRNNDAQTMTAS